MWRLWFLIVAPFGAAAAILWLRERRASRPSTPDGLARQLAGAGLTLQRRIRLGVELREEYARPSSTAPGEGVDLTEELGPPMRVRLWTRDHEAQLWVSSRAELAALLEAHPEWLRGDYSTTAAFATWPRSPQGKPPG